MMFLIKEAIGREVEKRMVEMQEARNTPQLAFPETAVKKHEEWNMFYTETGKLFSFIFSIFAKFYVKFSKNFFKNFYV